MLFLVEVVLFGFGVYSILYVGKPKGFESARSFSIERFDDLSCTLFSIAGLFYLGLWVQDLSLAFANANENGFDWLTPMILGPYGYTFWIRPLLVLFSTQILWVKKWRRNKILRTIIAISMVFSIEKLVLSLSFLNRDYLPSSWSFPFADVAKAWMKRFLCYFVLMVSIYFIDTQGAKIKQKIAGFIDC